MKFCDGQQLKRIFWGEENYVEVDKEFDGVKCTAITVSMEAAQMGLVPWAVAKFSDGTVYSYNLAKAEGVLF